MKKLPGNVVLETGGFKGGDWGQQTLTVRRGGGKGGAVAGHKMEGQASKTINDRAGRSVLHSEEYNSRQPLPSLAPYAFMSSLLSQRRLNVQKISAHVFEEGLAHRQPSAKAAVRLQQHRAV